MRPVVVALFVVASLPAAGWAGEPVAVLINARGGQGEVHVRASGDARWNEATLFLELREHDEIRVTGQAEADVFYLKASKPETVTAAKSPYTIRALPASSTGSTRVDLVAERLAAMFLRLSKEKPPVYVQLGGRGREAQEGAAPVIVGPRATRLFSAPTLFEWIGPDGLYTVTVMGVDGKVVWVSPPTVAFRVNYPDSAPLLLYGAKYTWRLGTEGRFADEEAAFEILPLPDVMRIRQLLDDLGTPAAGGVSSTSALLRAGLLFQEGLYEVARLELLVGLADRPEDPSLLYLLGHVYEQMGLQERATDSFLRAEAAMPSRPAR